MEIGIIAILGSILLLICLCCVYAFKRSRQKHRRTIGTDNNPTAEVNDTINSLAGVRATLAGVRAMLSHSQSLDARTSQIFNRNTSGHTATSALQTRDVPELLHIPELGSAGATNYHCDSPPPAYDSVVFVKLDDPDLLPTYAEVIAHPSEFSHQDNRPA